MDRVPGRLARADETLKEATVMVQHEFWGTAINRLYYAAFYAAHAYVLAKDQEPKTHKGTRLLFGALVKGDPHIPEDAVKVYHELFDERHEADYSFFVDADRDLVMPLFEPVGRFIRGIKASLGHVGMKVEASVPDEFMLAAIAEARQGRSEGGIPQGLLLERHGMIIARGYRGWRTGHTLINQS